MQVGCQLLSLLMQFFHSRFFEDIERSLVRGHGQHRRIAELPSFRRWNWLESLLHFESRFLLISPPSRKPWKRRILHMTLVNERAGNSTRTGVEIFVRTPACEVDIPVVKLQLHIPRSVR